MGQAETASSQLEGELFAAIDMGSNSFHLVVARYEHDRLHVIDRIKEMVRLAEGVDEAGRLDPDVQERALDCLTLFAQRIEGIDASRIAAVGTNALRKMKQGWRFLDMAEKRLGASIEIISGHEEARLVYLGVAHGVAERGRQRLVIDVGGGSTEFAIGSDFTPLVLESMYFGCVGVARKYFRNGKITAKRWRKAKNAVSVELQRIQPLLTKEGWEDAIGSSGTMRAVRKVLIEEGWSERGITADGVAKLRDRIIAAGHADALTLSGLSERRRPVFASGALIVDACLDTLPIDRILVAEYALREGLLYDLLGRIRSQDPSELSVRGLMEKYHVDHEQAERVERAALDLFDQVAEGWKLTGAARDWLSWGARLHEVGLTISHHGYHRHGAYLIENSDLPGFSRQEQQVLGSLVQLHRRKPDIDHLSPMLERVRLQLLRVASLLRLAVLIHRTRAPDPQPRVEARIEKGRLILAFPGKWLDAHPLTRADLEQESRRQRKMGIRFELD